MARFTDFNIRFRPNPLTNDLALVNDIQAINQSLRGLVSSRYSDEPFRSSKDFPLSIEDILFQNMSGAIINEIQEQLFRKILKYEKRILVQSIDITPEKEYSVSIVITYKIKTTQEITSLKILLERI